MYSGKSRLRKIWLDKGLKSRVSEDNKTNNTANGLKHCCNLNGSTFAILLSALKVGALEKVFFSTKQNPQTVCYYIGYR